MSTTQNIHTRTEPQTGERYAECSKCGRESIRGPSDILHKTECSEGDR